jgi:hypothetical protein
MITTNRVAPDAVALSSAVPGPGGMMFPVNAYRVLGVEATLVDTGFPAGQRPRNPRESARSIDLGARSRGVVVFR